MIGNLINGIIERQKAIISAIPIGIIAEQRKRIGSIVFELVERAVMDFGEVKPVKQAPVLPVLRSFAPYLALADKIAWQHCRERFAPNFTETTKEILFCIASGQENQIAVFIQKIEDLMRISLSSDKQVGEDQFPYTKFCKTDKPYALHVAPSSFWLACEMRRQLFTIFLRCGMQYDIQKNNFDEAIWKEEYAQNTKIAIMRFLFGFTRFTNDNVAFNQPIKVGWVTCWHAKSIAQINRQLTKSIGKPTLADIFFKSNLSDCIFA